MTTATLRARAPLFLAVFIDIFSFGLMYPLIVGLFESPWITATYSPSARDTPIMRFCIARAAMTIYASVNGHRLHCRLRAQPN